MSEVIEVDFKSRTIKNITYQSKELIEGNEDKINNTNKAVVEEDKEEYNWSTVQEVTQCYNAMLDVVRITINMLQEVGYDKPNAQQITVRMMEDCIDELWENGVL